jgi:hypothetical protein
MTEETAMPKVTLYVKESDSPVWDKAKKLTGNTDESLSGVVSELLKSYVERHESQKSAEEKTGRSMQELEFELGGELNNNIRRTARFTGALLATGHGYQVGGDQNQYALFVTSGGSLVVHATSGRGSTVEIFRRFDDFNGAVEYREDGEYRLAFGNALPDIAKIFGEDFTLWIH